MWLTHPPSSRSPTLSSLFFLLRGVGAALCKTVALLASGWTERRLTSVRGPVTSSCFVSRVTSFLLLFGYIFNLVVTPTLIVYTWLPLPTQGVLFYGVLSSDLRGMTRVGLVGHRAVDKLNCWYTPPMHSTITYANAIYMQCETKPGYCIGHVCAPSRARRWAESLKRRGDDWPVWANASRKPPRPSVAGVRRTHPPS